MIAALLILLSACDRVPASVEVPQSAASSAMQRTLCILRPSPTDAPALAAGHAQRIQAQVEVEIAGTRPRRALGLMDRDQLATDRGMLFVYPERGGVLAEAWLLDSARASATDAVAQPTSATRQFALLPPDSGYWMFRTHFPLDLAYLDEQGYIRAIVRAEPCSDHNPNQCPIYPAGVGYLAVLEVNAGYLAGQGVQLGDRVVLAPHGLANPCGSQFPEGPSSQR